ncbi:MAG: monovalent cation/H(+) antiporter subunit G [Candidatus Saelkia tenebricola]|nr:monovalent cation/H(+) antiporter subunit G [Candidatus Saelkia tenebricola]
MIELIGQIFIIIGLFFDFIGCLGLVRFPDVYNRLQAATKCVTFGTCSILFGTFLIMGLTAAGIKALLCIFFLVLTSPAGAHAIAKSSQKAGVKLWEGSVVNQYQEKTN